MACLARSSFLKGYGVLAETVRQSDWLRATHLLIHVRKCLEVCFEITGETLAGRLLLVPVFHTYVSVT